MKDIVISRRAERCGKDNGRSRALARVFPDTRVYECGRDRTRDFDGGRGVGLLCGGAENDRAHAGLRSCCGKASGLRRLAPGKSYLPLLERCKQDGWRITLMYFWLPSPQQAIDRVAEE